MRRPLAAAVLVALLASCGTPTGPVAIPTDELPFPLQRSLDPPAGSTPRAAVVTFVRRGRLVEVRRSVPGALSPGEAAMRALLAGPTAQERGRGIRTEIPPQTRLLDMLVVGQIAEVDLSGEFQSAAPSDSIVMRVAQVVWTLVRLPDVAAVRFLIDGVPVSTLTARGEVVDRPVTAADYASLSPRKRS